MARKSNFGHENYERKEKLKVGSDRTFGLVFAGVFFVLAVSPLIFSIFSRAVLMILSISFLSAALLSPEKLHVLNIYWAKLGLLIGKIVSPLILSVLFFIAFVPTGLLLRIFGKDILKIKLDPKSESYWINSAETYESSMKDQF